VAKSLLQDAVPELAAELQRLLSETGEHGAAAQIADLAIISRCRCGDAFCASFHTAPPPDGVHGPDHRTIRLAPGRGYLNVDVVGTDIVYVEVLYRDDLKGKILAAVP
jgi:hypothetical protein